MEKKNLKRKIAILSIALVLTSTYAVSAIVTFMEKDFAIKQSFSENLISLPSLFILIMTLMSEKFTRKIGLKSCVVYGLSLVFLSGIIPPIFKSLGSVIVSRILLGLGIGFFCSHSANFINLFYKDYEREKLQGIRNSMEFTGQIIMLFLAGLLIKKGWIYSFLIYGLAIFILIFFYRNVEDVQVEVGQDRPRINTDVVLFMAIAAFCIMDITAMTIRFAPIAEANLGVSTNVSALLTLIPIVGMVCGFFYGRIYEKFKNKTVLLGLLIYTGANILISFSEHRFYLYLASTLIVTLAQSMVMPYLFSRASTLVERDSERFATNMIFVACNLGAFLASLVINSFSSLIRTESLSLGFLIFSILSFILLILFNNFAKKQS